MDNEEKTDFESICLILSDLWVNHRNKKEFVDFISYNDLGLPLAFLVDSELVTPTEIGKKYVEETWEILLKSLDIEDDPGFTCLEDLFNYVGGGDN